MTIRIDILQRFGISENELFSFERAGLFDRHFGRNSLLFTEDDELRLRIILKALDLGFTLGDIAKIFEAMK